MGTHTKFLILRWLSKRGEGSPYEFWKEVRPELRYDTVVKYFMELRKGGRIEVIREEENSRRTNIKKKIYAIKRA